MKTKTILTALLMVLTQAVWAGATWIGTSYININDAWYKASGTGDWATGGVFDGTNLGKLTTLAIGGQIQVHADNDEDWKSGVCAMSYKFDDDGSTTGWSEHTLSYNTYGGDYVNNMMYQSGGDTFTTETIDISALSYGEHTISIFFGPLDGHYDSNNSQNYKATFTKAYTITYNLNGGSLTTEHNMYYNESITLDQPTRNNYDFDGWYDNEELTGDPVTTIAAGSTGNVELWAKWVDGYYVPFNYEGDYDNPILTIAPERDYYAEGRTVTLTVTKTEGVVLESISVSTQMSFDPITMTLIPSTEIAVTKVDDTHYTFTMPASSVQVEYDYYINNRDYAINLSDNLEGIVKARISIGYDQVYVRSANEGDEVTLLFEDSQGRMPSNLTVTTADNKAVTVTGSYYQYTFTMPANTVTVTADMKYGLQMMTQGSEYGTVTAKVDGAEATTADAGKTVTLIVSPATNYALSDINVTYADMISYESVEVSLTKVSDTEYTFTMPAATVQIMPMFVFTLADAADNSTTISELVQDGFYGSVMLQGRTLWKNNTWNTLCLPFNVTEFDISPSGMIPVGYSFPLQDATLKVLDVDNTYDDEGNASATGTNRTGYDVESGTLSLYFKDPVASNDVLIPAGTPFLAKWTTGDNIVNPTFSGKAITITNPSSVPADNNNVTFVGTFDPVLLTKNTTSNLYLGSGSNLYYPNVDNFYVNAFRAYFLVDLGDNTEGVRSFKLNFGDDEASAIEGVDWRMNKEAGTWYSLDGRKLGGKATKAGVYIVNGKKVVIK